jgi:hypothetical protein
MLAYSVNLFVLSVFLLTGANPPLSWNFNKDASGSLPMGWEAHGASDPTTTYQVRSEPDGNRYIAARSQGTDVQLGIRLAAKSQESSILSWRWRVWELPRGADERVLKTLDSAASVYAVFGSRFFPRILKYVWSTSAPAGSSFKHPNSSRMAIIVLNSGSSSLGQWMLLRRNLAEDYKQAFGSQPDNLIAIAIKTDSDSTHSSAQADYDDIQLTRQ